MNVDLSKREIHRLAVVLDNEIVDFDQRLSLMENGGAGTTAYGIRCQLKVLASRFNQLEKENDGQTTSN